MKRLLALTLAGVLLISLFAGGIALAANAEEPTTTVESLRLQPFDSLDGFWTTVADGLALHTEGMKQGTGYITRGSWENIICNNTFVNKDLTGYENGWVRLWLYVSDAGVLGTGDGQQAIHLKTGDGSTSFVWDLRGMLQTGWNDVKLPFANAVSTGNIADVNTLQTVFYGTADVVIGLDDLRVEREVPGNIKTAMLHNCDSIATFWTTVADGMALHTSGAQEGTGYVTRASWENIVCANGFATTDLTEYSSGWVRLWLYVSDAGVLGTGDGQQTLYLKTGDGSTSFAWDLCGTLKTGWNDVKLPFANAVTTGNIADVNTLQMVFYATADVVIGIDALRVEYEVISEPDPTPDPDPEPTDPEPTDPEPTDPEPTDPEPTDPDPTYIEFTTIDKVDSAEGWSGWFTYDFVEFPASAIELDTEDKKEGEGSLKAHNGGVSAFSRTFGPMDLSAYKDAGYLHLWFFVDDVTKLNEASIELTSSGDADQQEISWVLSGLSTGWNELYLPVTEGTAQGGSIDWTAVNYIRVVTNGEVTVGVDDISMCNYGIPQTGDLFFGLAVAALTLSAAMLTGTVVMGRKKRS